MKPKHFTLPSAESEFLSDVLESIRKRSKSIKHNVWEFGVERIIEQYEASRIEKLEIKIKPSNYHAFANIDIWEDRWVQVSAFERTKDAKWDWHREGMFLPTYAGKELVAAFQDMAATFYQMEAAEIHEFDNVWKPLLASKPELVR